MSLKGNLEKIEVRPCGGKDKHSKRHGWMKKFRNRWLRRKPVTEVPNTKERKGWEY